jgi:Tol biopolymer transport system component/DNA-binding winged helix-turn-helix (wHTH) protein
MSANRQPVPVPEPTRYKFGTFELNVQSGELRRNGTKLRLQDQPFLVLRKLLESAGGLVSREDLHAALWPADTFVEFDTSLNTAIKRLREALGDSADTPVFIETVPRRGYRFLAPIQVIHGGAPLAASAMGISSRHTGRLRWGLLLTALVVAAAIGGTIVAFRSPAASPRVVDSTQLTFDGLEKGNLRLRGGKLYFNEASGNRVVLAELPAAGGTATLLGSDMYLADVASDSSKLFVWSAEKEKKRTIVLKVMDLASGSVQNLENLEVDDASSAPGGKIIFSMGGEVFLADPDGSNKHKLLSVPGRAFNMRFSPDGARLRLSVTNMNADQISSMTIWEARADGSGLHEILTRMPEDPDRCCGEWSPDGRYYFFQTSHYGSDRIWAQAERRSFLSKTPDPVPLTTMPPNFHLGAPSEDGKKLFVTAEQPRAELVRYDSRARQFLPFLAGLSAGDVESSRDGQNLIYIRYPEDTLWRAKADGSEPTQLTGPSLRATLPHWSPNGRQIVFSGSRPGHAWSLFVISALGGPAEQLTTASVSDLDPAWSPDGSTIAYGEARTDGKKQSVSIQMLDLASRKSTTLAGSEGICCPRWSPDGRYLLASHSEYDDLLLYEFATEKWNVIAKGIGMIGYMEFTDAGKSIMFDTLLGPDPAFYRIRLSDTHLETVAKIGDLRRYFGPFGPWAGVAPDGSPLLVRDISNEEIYSLDLDLP